MNGILSTHERSCFAESIGMYWVDNGFDQAIVDVRSPTQLVASYSKQKEAPLDLVGWHLAKVSKVLRLDYLYDSEQDWQ